MNASQLLATDTNKKLQSLDVATYPSLTELSYVRGVTSAVQTQLNGTALLAGRSGGQTINGGTLTTQNLTLRANAADLTSGYVRFLDTTTASNATTAGVVMDGGLAVAKKIYSTDLQVTNTITGAISGNAGTVTNGVYTNAANSMSLINPLTTLAESWIGPSSTTGIYFKTGNLGIGTTDPSDKLVIVGNTNNTGFEFGNSATNLASLQIYDRVASAYRQFRTNALSYIWNVNGVSTGMVMDSTGNLGIGTTVATNILSLGGNAARTVWMERHTTANTAGNTLTIQAGGATAAATDKAGGNLILAPGLSTGTGNNQILFQTSTPQGSTNTTDNALVTRVTLDSTALQMAVPVRLKGYTVSTLPVGVQGNTAFITDGDAGLAWGATAVNSGAGATPYMVWYNGSAWSITGK